MRRCWRRGPVPFRPAFVWILLLRFKISLKLRLSGGAASCFISFLSVQRAYFNTNLSDMTGPPPACGHSPQPCDITGACCLPESKRALNAPSALPFQLDAALPLRSDDVSCCKCFVEKRRCVGFIKHLPVCLSQTQLQVQSYKLSKVMFLSKVTRDKTPSQGLRTGSVCVRTGRVCVCGSSTAEIPATAQTSCSPSYVCCSCLYLYEPAVITSSLTECNKNHSDVWRNGVCVGC